MKKHLLILFLLIAMILTGCASSAGNTEPVNGTDTIALPEEVETIEDPFSRNTQGEYDEDVTRDHFHNKDRETVPESADGLLFEDFDFYYDIMYDGVPEDAYFPAVKYAEGLWKYDLIFRYDSSTDGYYYEEMGYAELGVDYDRDQIIITLHPRMANDGYEAWPTSDREVGYEPFAGGFDENDNLRLYGNDAVIDCQYYYAYSGREYFISEIWISEEDFGMLLLTRGQN
ncbi:MAG: hypothetical protein IJI44_04500 [Erysipelotrichaceae bacterium]|nr:hypothetical protein [Erysipelotrichaceae bacterium]